MAALYAQGLAWGDMYKTVRKYAARMSSVHHLLLVRAWLTGNSPGKASCCQFAHFARGV